MAATLGELAGRFGLVLHGDPDVVIDGVGTLREAGPSELAFLANPRYRRQLADTRAGAVVLTAADAAECPVPALVAGNPYAAYARIASLLHPPPAVVAGVHPSAVVSTGARLGPGCSIGAQCYVGPEVVLGGGVLVGPGCVLNGEISVGEGVRLVARVTLTGRVVVGRRTIIHPGAVLGADGFGFAPDRDGWVKVPQLGGVRVGDDVEIGANTTIDCGAIGDTVIEDGVKLDNQIQVAHNVTIGRGTAIAAQVGISGSTRIGAGCLLAGQVGVAGHLEIADGVIVLGGTAVTSSIREPGEYSGLLPGTAAAKWRRTVARLHRIEDMHQRLKALEKTQTTGAATGEAGEREPT